MKIELKYEKIIFYIHNADECRDILLHCYILFNQLSFTANMKKKNPGRGCHKRTFLENHIFKDY
jgi:hypothetical protein